MFRPLGSEEILAMTMEKCNFDRTFNLFKDPVIENYSLIFSMKFWNDSVSFLEKNLIDILELLATLGFW